MNEATNNLLREISKAAKYYKLHGKDLSTNEIVERIASDKDVEVHTAIKVLIQTIINEQ